MKKNQPKRSRPSFDKKWMDKLLSIPEIAEKVDQMTANELEFYKDILVRSGVYGRYVIDQQKQAVRASVRENFPALVKD